MGISCGLLMPGCEDFLELSLGDKTIIFNKTRSHRLPLIAGLLAKDKAATNMLLRRSGLPLPDYIVVSDVCEEALQFFNRHNRVTVKPIDSSRSAGVTTAIGTEAELERAIRSARLHSSRVMVQANVEGYDYRVLIIDGQAIGVLEYRPASVEGDGCSTIAQLIVRLNEQQQRRNGTVQQGSFQPIDIGSAQLRKCLAMQGRTVRDIPAPYEQVQLFTAGNAAADQISEIVTDRTADIHPDSLRMAVEAAGALQIDVAGIDIRCQDISVPLGDANGGILEVNALPDMIDPHLYLQDEGTDVFRAYLTYLLKQ
jgi:D-alanine-D-alanine ligase-like ATP-grasp enzyme